MDYNELAATEAIASLVQNPTADEVVPSVFTDNLVEVVADVMK